MLLVNCDLFSDLFHTGTVLIIMQPFCSMLWIGIVLMPIQIQIRFSILMPIQIRIRILAQVLHMLEIFL